MLYLRRNIGERICVFDARAEVWIKLVDADMDSATISIGPGYPEDQTHEFFIGTQMPILQGDASVKLEAIRDWEDGSHYVSLGIQAPRSLKIEREEMIAGMSREERARVA